MSEKEKNSIGLNSKQIKAGTQRRVDRYKGLNFFEEFSMYMGSAQLLEFGLKKLLQEKFGKDLDEMEKWTLGRTAKVLKENDLREDFIFFLEEVVVNRNYIAHGLLVDDAIYNMILNKTSLSGQYPKSHRYLHKAIYNLEQLMFLFDWTNENNAWD